MKDRDLRIVFMGTPEFAIPSLEALLEGPYTVAAIVTSPDKPAGRGLILTGSPVKEVAVARGFTPLQPENLTDPGFLNELKKLQPNLQVIVGFRKLPREVWSLPRYGTFNLHASLLPQYRGAAPINWAIINGEKTTGVTTFFINDEIDTGKILFRREVGIGDHENAGDLHDRLAKEGAELVMETTRAISENSYRETDQNTLIGEGKAEMKKAPKIFREDCRINWSLEPERVRNMVRGLSPYPAAWTEIHTPSGDIAVLKVFAGSVQKTAHADKPGTLVTDNKTYLRVAVCDGYLHIHELQLEGKKRMGVTEFLRGFDTGGCHLG